MNYEIDKLRDFQIERILFRAKPSPNPKCMLVFIFHLAIKRKILVIRLIIYSYVILLLMVSTCNQ